MSFEKIFSLFLLLLLTSCSTSSLKSNDTISSKIVQQDLEEQYSSQLPNIDPAKVNSIKRIAFVCCNYNSEDEVLWTHILNAKPELVVVAGNSVSSIRIDQKPLDKAYQKLDQNRAYSKIRQEIPFLATWDHLDFGLRNGDSRFFEKEKNIELFKKYWGYIDNVQTKNLNDGVEHSVIFKSGSRKIHIILLDVRTFASPWIEDDKTTPPIFKKNWNPKQTLLGKKQWKWLEKELQKKVDLRIIISPLPLASNSSSGQRWGLLPFERQKLFNFIRNSENKNTYIISGHQNFGAIAKVELKNHGPLYDMTVGPLSGVPVNAEPDFHYLEAPYIGNNYGLIDIDWQAKKLKLTLRSIDNENVRSFEK